jgi:Ca-activated chloride channel family protein
LADVRPITDDPVAGLIDMPLPQEVSLWPETWASRIAVVVLLVTAVVAIWRFISYRRVNRYRREALAELTRITSAPDTAPGELAAQLSLLVRRTALAAFPREQIAPLSGAAWLAFLYRSSGGTEFSRGPGRWLASAPYAKTGTNDSQRPELIELTRRWIRGHHV